MWTRNSLFGNPLYCAYKISKIENGVFKMVFFGLKSNALYFEKFFRAKFWKYFLQNNVTRYFLKIFPNSNNWTIEKGRSSYAE